MILLRLGGVITTSKSIHLPCCSIQSRITPTNTEKNGPDFEQLKSELRGGGTPASASASAAAALRADTNNGGGVEVPRQKYIATSKFDLLDAIVMDEEDDVKQQFLLLSSYVQFFTSSHFVCY